MRSTVVSIIVLTCSVARAQSPTLLISSLERGEWPATVAALQADLRSEGQSIHVVVRDPHGEAIDCGGYTLSLDAPGSAALRILGCDATTRATELLLVSRSQLFSHDGALPRPRSIGLTAIEVRTGVVAGGAALSGGSALECSVGIRPYFDDLEHGTRVALTPDHYDVLLSRADVIVEAQTNGWRLLSSRAELDLEYRVLDHATRELVLEDRATLACGSGLPAAAPLVATPPAAAPPPPPLPPAPAGPPPPDPWEEDGLLLSLMASSHLLLDGVPLSGGGRGLPIATQDVDLQMLFRSEPWLWWGAEIFAGYSALPSGVADITHVGMAIVVGLRIPTAPLTGFAEVQLGVDAEFGSTASASNPRVAGGQFSPTLEVRAGPLWILSPQWSLRAWASENVFALQNPGFGLGAAYTPR